MSRTPLEQLRETLEALGDLVKLGQERYEADRLVRWSIERLWLDTVHDITRRREQVNEAATASAPPRTETGDGGYDV